MAAAESGASSSQRLLWVHPGHLQNDRHRPNATENLLRGLFSVHVHAAYGAALAKQLIVQTKFLWPVLRTLRFAACSVNILISF